MKISEDGCEKKIQIGIGMVITAFGLLLLTAIPNLLDNHSITQSALESKSLQRSFIHSKSSSTDVINDIGAGYLLFKISICIKHYYLNHKKMDFGRFWFE